MFAFVPLWTSEGEVVAHALAARSQRDAREAVDLGVLDLVPGTVYVPETVTAAALERHDAEDLAVFCPGPCLPETLELAKSSGVRVSSPSPTDGADVTWVTADDPAADQIAAHARDQGREVHAIGVLEAADRARAGQVGASVMAGEWVHTSAGVPGRPVPTSRLGQMRKLLTSAGTLEELERFVRTDPGLTYRLLRYVNSAYLSTGAEVTSLRQALMRIGTSGARRWMVTVTMVGGRDRSDTLALTALRRARMSELLAPDPAEADLLFTAGLLSLADAMTGLAIGDVVDELGLGGPAAEALTGYRGPLGARLLAVIQHSSARFGQAASSLAWPYLDACRWACDTQRAV